MIQQVLAMAILLTVCTDTDRNKSPTYSVTYHRLKPVAPPRPFSLPGTSDNGWTSWASGLSDPTQPGDRLSRLRTYHGRMLAIGHSHRVMPFVGSPVDAAPEMKQE